MAKSESKNVKRLTLEQMNFVLLDIAETAQAISCLTTEVVGGSSTTGLDELLPGVIDKLSQRIGLMASLAQGEWVLKTEVDPIAWMMPPAYFDAVETV
jgi:hypothetical protein